MASPVPTPIAAAVGLLPATVSGVRRLPGRAATKAVTLPVLAISSALSGLDLARREYEDLAERGDRLIARLRGQAGELADEVVDLADDLEDRVEDLVQRTPLATAYDRAEDALEDAADRVADGFRAVAATVEDVPEDEQPKGVPTPRATGPDTSRVDTAASADVVAVVEQVAPTSVVPAHDELPLADYDHMTLGSLRGRLRSLSLEQLALVRSYEKAHADRLPIVTMLDNRIARLATDPAAAPSGPVAQAPNPGRSTPGRPAKITPATAAPAPPTPSQGDPTNPARPR